MKIFEKAVGGRYYHEANRQALTYKPACAPKFRDRLSFGKSSNSLERWKETERIRKSILHGLEEQFNLEGEQLADQGF